MVRFAIDLIRVRVRASMESEEGARASMGGEKGARASMESEEGARGEHGR